jgi:hypothetical protein
MSYDHDFIRRKTIDALLEPASDGQATATVRRVDRLSLTAYVSVRGSASGVWLPVANQSLADLLDARVAAGDRPAVRVERDQVVGYLAAPGGVRGGSGAGIVSQPQNGGTKPGGALFAPAWREASPVIAGVHTLRLAWQPIFGASVIGYRVSLTDVQGIITYYNFAPDETDVAITGLPAGNVLVRVQGIAAGGVAGDWSSPRQADVLADLTPPDVPGAITHSWSAADRTLDLHFRWTAPTLPPDFAGYDVEIRNPNGTIRRAYQLDGNVLHSLYRYEENRADAGGASPTLVLAVRSRDVYDNASAWSEANAVFPPLPTPTVPPRLSTIFKQVTVEVDPAPPFTERTEVFVSPGDHLLRIGAQSTHTAFFGVTGTQYSAMYRWIDVWGRETHYSPQSRIEVARNDIGFDDLGALEQVQITSSYGSRSKAELAALIDSRMSDAAFSTVAGEIVSFAYPLATRIAGIMLYTPSQTTPQFYLRYTDGNGVVRLLGANSVSDRTTNGSVNNMLLRELGATDTGTYVSMATESIGGYWLREWRFGDSTATASLRQFKAITTRQFEIVFVNSVPISEIRVLTYEAANTFVARRMYLSEGLQIQNNIGVNGFAITSSAITGYDTTGADVGRIGSNGDLWWKRGGFGGSAATPNVRIDDIGLYAKNGSGSTYFRAEGLIGYNGSGVEQIRIDSADGKLKAAAGRVIIDANRYVTIQNGNGALAGTMGASTDYPFTYVGIPEGSGYFPNFLQMKNASVDGSYRTAYVHEFGAGLGAVTSGGAASYVEVAPGTIGLSAQSIAASGRFVLPLDVTDGSNFGTGAAFSGFQSGTINISEDTIGNGRLPMIQFHANGYQEAAMWLNAGSTRLLNFGDSQGVGLHVSFLQPSRTATSVYIHPNKRLGIGVFPTYQLHLEQDSAAKPGSNVWTVVSGRETKKEESIRPYTEGLDMLSRLQPVYFQYNGTHGTPNDGHEYVGFIAQDVAKVAPSMVKKIKHQAEVDGEAQELLAVNLNDLQYMLVNGTTALKHEVDQIKEQLTKLGINLPTKP